MKQNILFGLPFEEDKYRQVLQASQLHLDISNLPHGDATEIGMLLCDHKLLCVI